MIDKEPELPQSDLGKLLLTIVQYLGALEPQAFVRINVMNALNQADRLIAKEEKASP